MTQRSDSVLPKSPPEARYVRGDVVLCLYILMLSLFFTLKYSISQLPPQPKVVGSSADRIRTGTQEDIEVTARVKNLGETGAVTVYANLKTDKGEWEQRETVVVPKSSKADFRFLFRGWTGENATFSVSLAEDHLFQALQHVAVPPYSKIVLPK